jgi:3D (Asp-Asp-Asp) domain-containing protein
VRLPVAAFFCAVAAMVAVVPQPAGAADGASSLRARSATLAHEERAALYALYAQDAALQQARARAELEGTRVALLTARTRLASTEVHVARSSLGIARRNLEARLIAIYKSRPVDPLQVILSSGSLAEAIASVDALHQLAAADREVVDRTRAARLELEGSYRQLRAMRDRARHERALLRAAVATLASERSDKQQYLDGLHAERTRLSAQLASIEAAAAAAVQRSQGLQAQAATGFVQGQATAVAAETVAPAVSAGIGSPHGSLVVSATAYGLPGRTASGLPTGPGICAVDPNVIPLGTRFYVQGYGPCIAADVGSAIIGARIDLWMPYRQCLIWGRRTVTITFSS